MIDLETTGFSPQDDRIVEIACVRIRADGTVIEQFSTLVNPGRRVTGTDIHGISDRDVADAPALLDVAGHVARLLDGAVLASYNVYFDFPFLREGLLAPLGVRDTVPRLCCMYLRGQVGLVPSRLKLATALAEQGLALEDAHTAHDDAVGASRLLPIYLRRAGVERFADLALRKRYAYCDSWEHPLVSFPAGLSARSAVPRTRGARKVVSVSETTQAALRRGMERMSTRFPGSAYEAYLAVLEDALEDNVVTEDEVETLSGVARAYGLTPEQVTAVHRELRTVLADDHELPAVTERVRVAIGAPPASPPARSWGGAALAVLVVVVVAFALAAAAFVVLAR